VNKNNLLFYLGQFSRMGDVAGGISAVLGVCDQFDVIVARRQLAPEESKAMRSVIAGWRISNPASKFFAYTSLGASLDLAAWVAEVEANMAEFGTALTGIFIDNFGFDSALSTRTNQNAAVEFCHDRGLAVFVRAKNVIDVFDTISSPITPAIGRLPTIKDAVLLTDFYQINSSDHAPASEPQASVIGRLQFSLQARTDRSAWPNTNLNLEFGAIIGAGLLSEIDLRNVWVPAANATQQYKVEYLGVVPSDESASTNKFFIRNIANQFVYAPPAP
jgi:hypothetical protein